MALSTIFINSPPKKETVRQLGCIDRIEHAYDLLSRNLYEDPFLTTKTRACIAITALAVDPIVLSDLWDKGIIVKFDPLLRMIWIYLPNYDASSKVCLHWRQMEKILIGAKCFRKALEDESCDCICSNLRVIAIPAFTPNRITYLRTNVHRAMKRFPSAASVHQNGCKLLACVFVWKSSESTAQCMILTEELVEEELGTMTKSLAKHKNDPTNAAAACCVLGSSKLCLMFSQSDFVMPKVWTIFI